MAIKAHGSERRNRVGLDRIPARAARGPVQCGWPGTAATVVAGFRDVSKAAALVKIAVAEGLKLGTVTVDIRDEAPG